jgi:phosphoglycolate phosphatase-like HAD superfamily hydrolase
VRGQQPVIFRAEREAEIRGAIRFAEEMKLKPIILGGNDAWKVASLLKEKNVPVILTGVFSLPVREDDAYDTLYENPAKLQQAGVLFAISTGDSGPEVRNLAQYAGMAGLRPFESRRGEVCDAQSRADHERRRPPRLN